MHVVHQQRLFILHPLVHVAWNVQRVLDHCVSFAMGIPLARTVVAAIHFMKTRRTAALVMSPMEWWVVSTCTLRVNVDAMEPFVLLVVAHVRCCVHFCLSHFDRWHE